MPRIELDNLPVRTGSAYPAPLDREMQGRSQIRLGDAAGLTQFGVNLVRLDPGAMSSLMHWHEQQDEFLVVTEGRLTLVEESGETALAPGDCCAFPAGVANGHHIVNRSDAPGSFVVVGTRTRSETGWYPGRDLKVRVEGGQMRFERLDGSDPSAPEGPQWVVFDRIDTQLTRALLEGDFGRYRAIVHLPLTIVSPGLRYTLEDEAALEADFRKYHEVLRAQGIVAIRRRVTAIAGRGTDTRDITCTVVLIGAAGPVVEPIETRFRVARHDAVWNLTAVEGSRGHISWARGLAHITPDARFELD